MQNISKRALILDTGNQACDGKLYDRDFLMGISHTLLPFYELALRAREAGIPCLTPGEFLADTSAWSDTEMLIITHLVNDRTQTMIDHGAVPFLLMCQESPFIATRFYLMFKGISKPFRHTMAFEGMRRRAHPNTTFHTMHFPLFVDETLPPSAMSFSERKNVVLVAGNKGAGSLKTFLLKPFYSSRVQLIYPRRKSLVGKLASAKQIDLYGRGWENDPNPEVKASAKGLAPADGKYDILGRYKFTICYENAIFPGYVTEKLFDALLAGTVPIYLGDPEIEKTVPKAAYVDVRDFKNEEALATYLKEMTEGTHAEYLRAGREFLAANTFKEYTHEVLIERIKSLINAYER